MPRGTHKSLSCAHSHGPRHCETRRARKHFSAALEVQDPSSVDHQQPPRPHLLFGTRAHFIISASMSPPRTVSVLQGAGVVVGGSKPSPALLSSAPLLAQRVVSVTRHDMVVVSSSAPSNSVVVVVVVVGNSASFSSRDSPQKPSFSSRDPASNRLCGASEQFSMDQHPAFMRGPSKLVVYSGNTVAKHSSRLAGDVASLHTRGSQLSRATPTKVWTALMPAAATRIFRPEQQPQRKLHPVKHLTRVVFPFLAP
mmetsp:Transcript_22043/g.53670  ORF Transcript_22043/g.53670 Transcript_22043/m.53670 type:complete len:254 (+) Transcript_22043:1119-1880(+)